MVCSEPSVTAATASTPVSDSDMAVTVVVLVVLIVRLVLIVLVLVVLAVLVLVVLEVLLLVQPLDPPVDALAGARRDRNVIGVGHHLAQRVDDAVEADVGQVRQEVGL